MNKNTKLVFDYIKNNGGKRAHDIPHNVGLIYKEVDTEINKLIKQGFIQKVIYHLLFWTGKK